MIKIKLIVARHGETEWNALNKVLGRTDIPLNSRGKEQAYRLATLLEDKKIEIVITSPLERAFLTGKIVAEKLQAKLQKNEILTEQNFGIYEGIDRTNVNYQKAKREYTSRYPKGESYLDVAARIYPFLNDLSTQYKDKTILIVTHGGICRIINSYFEDMDNETFASFVMPNCGFKEYNL